MAKYRIFIVTRNRDHHYPVIMANNGKAMLNEPVKRAGALEKSAANLLREERYLAYGHPGAQGVEIVRITEKDFKAKFPKFARNAGPKKKRAKPTAKFKAGDKVTIIAGTWGKVIGRVISRSKTSSDTWYCEVTGGRYKGSLGYWLEKDIAPRSEPEKRVTKRITNPVK